MNKIASADIVIFGGGIAGLWLLSRLRASNLSVILFESGTLGGGQTNKSQGIIHGGMKYALSGTFTKDANAMTGMPKIWQDCFEGSGDLDLSTCSPILSKKHYLFSTGALASKITGFLANTTLKSQVKRLHSEQYPSPLQHTAFKGEVFELDEMVIDVPLLVRELVKANQDVIFQIEPFSHDEFQFDAEGRLTSVMVYQSGMSIEVKAQQFIFTAGAGNEVLVNKFRDSNLAMQRRPLHMVLVKMPFACPLYAHCLNLGPRPRLTITTHYTHDGEPIWYLGGQLAEDGIRRDGPSQIKAAQKELNRIFPWLDFSGAEFASFMVDRAEAYQENGFKPETSFMKVINNMMIAWPTKLALAPKLADDIVNHLKEKNLNSKYADLRALRAWPMPPMAAPVWEEFFCAHVA